MELAHNNTTPFKCEHPGCDFKTSQAAGLNNHSKIHRTYRKDLNTIKIFCLDFFAEILWSCKFCEGIFKDKPELDAHVIASHKDLRPTYRCDQCAFTTNKLYNLKAHRKRHGYKEFKCSDCNYETHERCKLANHIQKHHSTGPARYQEGIIFPFITFIQSHTSMSHTQGRFKLNHSMVLIFHVPSLARGQGLCGIDCLQSRQIRARTFQLFLYFSAFFWTISYLYHIVLAL